MNHALGVLIESFTIALLSTSLIILRHNHSHGGSDYPTIVKNQTTYNALDETYPVPRQNPDSHASIASTEYRAI